MIALDTNLLVYAHRRGTPEHASAIRALKKAFADPQGWGIAWLSIGEFWSVVTHPACTGRPSRPEEAAGFLSAIVTDGDGAIWFPGHGFAERVMRLAIKLGTTGPRFFDLQIGLIALDHGARTLWTHDANFTRLPGLPIVDPL